MESNYSLTKLFVSKIITIFPSPQQSIQIDLHCLRSLFDEPHWNMFYHIITSDPKKFFNADELMTPLAIIKLIIFEFGKFDRFAEIYSIIIEQLPRFVLDLEIDYENKELVANHITITDEIWDYSLYLLKLSCGEKVVQPPAFTSPEARKLYMAQQENEDRIAKLRGKQGSSDNVIKTLLAITYSFPSLTFDYLFDQTMAQIQWLQKLAAGAASYEVNAQAYAAGNVKKGKKLDFFIK